MGVPRGGERWDLEADLEVVRKTRNTASLRRPVAARGDRVPTRVYRWGNVLPRGRARALRL